MSCIAIQDTTTREKAQNGRGWSEDGTSYTLDAAATQGVAIPLEQPPKAIGFYSTGGSHGLGNNVDVSPAVKVGTALDIPSPPAVAFPINGMTVNKELRDKQMTGIGGGCDPMFAVRSSGQQHAVAFEPRYYTRDNKTGGRPSETSVIKADASKVGDSAPHVATAMAVRRLTPRECERLQGFPDDHTLIPWRGKPADQCPDGPRYKALGNSMAVPCMRWIGERIAAQEMFPLRYLSVCSGIEAASVAWEPLGWKPEAFAEVEKFPSAVLAHHWPNVPNLGDMTQYEQWKLGAIDLLVGGTPCQSFSVAGLRQGLRDPRGGLMLTYLEIAQRHRPRWLVWENVPGVLSSHGGRDFGAFLGALGDLGYGWAYRVLDAQWFGVAQRRRRVFVVANAGDGAAAATVLFESESVRRNPAPSREAGQGVAADAAGGAGGRSWPAGVASTLRKENGSPGYANQDIFSQGGANLVPAIPETVGTLSDGAHNGGGLTAKMPTPGAYSPCVANPLTARMGKGINTTLDEGQTPIVESISRSK
jgi:site-specific DNA-cytosine methylase